MQHLELRRERNILLLGIFGTTPLLYSPPPPPPQKKRKPATKVLKKYKHPGKLIRGFAVLKIH